MGKDWEEYRKYLRSDKWSFRKLTYFLNHDKKCRRCRSTSRVQLHHMDYANVGKEPDSDLIALCRDCHYAVHSFHRKNGGTLREATLKMVAITPAPKKAAKYVPKKFTKRKK